MQRDSRRSKRRIISQSHESESSNDNDDDDDEEGPSVSSRGRIRKPTAKARGFH